MAGPAWMPFYPADYLADTGHLTTTQHGAYLLLILHYWRTGGLPDDDRQLARIARMSDREWKGSRDVLSGLFQGGWTHKRIDVELARAADKGSARADAGRLGGLARAAKLAGKRQANATDLPKQNPADDLAFSSESESEPTSLRSVGNAGEPASSNWPRNAGDQFWAVYPNKVGRKAAIAKLDQIRKSGEVPFERLMAGLRRYVAKTDDRSWCNPLTWLNQGRWDDEPAHPVATLFGVGGSGPVPRRGVDAAVAATRRALAAVGER